MENGYHPPKCSVATIDLVLLHLGGGGGSQELCMKPEQSKLWLRSFGIVGKPGGKRRK